MSTSSTEVEPSSLASYLEPKTALALAISMGMVQKRNGIPIKLRFLNGKPMPDDPVSKVGSIEICRGYLGKDLLPGPNGYIFFVPGTERIDSQNTSPAALVEEVRKLALSKPPG